MPESNLSLSWLRDQIIGVDATFPTPFGERLMVYCDYTASGRCLRFVEDYLQGLQRVYANTHTEDDISGRSMSRLLKDAETCIKECVNAGPDGRIIACGTGATGAIDKLQQIIGVAWPPASRENLMNLLGEFTGVDTRTAFAERLKDSQPVVFVGPYEHHSNEISWREGLATVVEVNLATDGSLDLGHLESLLREPAYRNRLRIGSFSAASNVTGMITDVHAVARLLHAHDALACFDYAAAAPYVHIDMNPPADAAGDASLDAVFISPHKFLGGPGSSGVLVFNRRIYHEDLPPSVSGGGTVDYVSPDAEDFIADIEERERAGTPGVLQTLKAALAFDIKRQVTVARIHEREQALARRAIGRWTEHGGVEILGNPDPERRIGIISFNVRDARGGYLHPKFITALLNDLFGIQTRAGCSCAGPYGHRLLHIDNAHSQRYRDAVSEGFCGLKPGWCRLGLHYVMDDAEADFVIDAVLFAADHGHRFLPAYAFDLATGTWTHREASDDLPAFSLQAALTSPPADARLDVAAREQLYAGYFAQARAWLDRQPEGDTPGEKLSGELAELQFFSLP